MTSKQSLAFVAVTLGSGIALGALSLRGAPELSRTIELAARGPAKLEPLQLARWIIEGRRDFVVVDLRASEAFAAGHVRDAVHCGSCHEDRAGGKRAQEEHFIDLTKKLVLYTATGAERVQLPKILADNPRVHVLAGGYAGWKEQVLAPIAISGERDARELDEKRERAAIRAFFTGERAVTSVPARLPLTPIRRAGAHAPAGPSEGC